MLFASFRLAIAIVCIGVSLLLATIYLGLTERPLRMLAFFVVAGSAVYWVFVARVIRGFEVAQVVPDRVREALDTLSEGLIVTDENDCIVLANRAFSQLVDVKQERLLGRRAGTLDWVCSESSTDEDFPWVRAVRQADPVSEQLMRYKMPDGSMRYFSINASVVQSSPSRVRGALATFRDVTASENHRAEREQLLAVLRNSQDEIATRNQELQILATQDSLTGCLNRRAMNEAIEPLWEDAKRRGQPIACLMIDNDHFKSVNDRFGHAVGDEVLRRVSDVLKEAFAPPHLVCRYGGEEFCIVMPSTTLQAATERAEQIRLAISQIRVPSEPELLLTASIGVSESGSGASDLFALIVQADECLYVAKGLGRNQVIAANSQADKFDPTSVR